jgi:cob(I)alamin adenosyltransferase
MGHRLSKIYTRTGDDGTLGLVLAVEDLPGEVRSVLTRIQHELFDLGGELSVPGMRVITEAHVTRLENDLDAFNDALPPLKEFILPSGGRATAACHLARAIARRAERVTWALAQDEPVGREVPQYLNRLSDLLFVLARVLVRHENGTEVLWKRS